MPGIRLLTSAEKARELGVGVSSVKRWADRGKLQFVLTPGGHRRFHPAQEPPAADADLLGAIPRPRREGGLAALLAISDRLQQIGDRWECGEISVAEEHRQSHAIAEMLDMMRRPREDGPLCILACPPGEQHELALRMVRLVLEWRGWRTDFLGASTPWDALERAVEETRPGLVALSSRSAIELPRPLPVPVVVGGAWARGPWRGIPRFRSLIKFDRWLASRGA